MLLQRLLNDCRRGVAPMFALLLVPLIATVGTGIDYAKPSRKRASPDDDG